MEPFVGQISIVGFNFPPKGWARCDGALLAIQQNAALFSLLGTTYGGDGVTTFRLPDLRGRAAMSWSGPNPLGTAAGTEVVTLTSQQIPLHTHAVNAVGTAGTAAAPTNGLWAASTTADQQYSLTSDRSMAPNAIAGGGGNQPHANMQPSLALNFIIAIQGIYPSRS